MKENEGERRRKEKEKGEGERRDISCANSSLGQTYRPVHTVLLCSP